jgi:hypothetical protein
VVRHGVAAERDVVVTLERGQEALSSILLVLVLEGP